MRRRTAGEGLANLDRGVAVGGPLRQRELSRRVGPQHAVELPRGATLAERDPHREDALDRFARHAAEFPLQTQVARVGLPGKTRLEFRDRLRREGDDRALQPPQIEVDRLLAVGVRPVGEHDLQRLLGQQVVGRGTAAPWHLEPLHLGEYLRLLDGMAIRRIVKVGVDEVLNVAAAAPVGADAKIAPRGGFDAPLGELRPQVVDDWLAGPVDLVEFVVLPGREVGITYVVAVELPVGELHHAGELQLAVALHHHLDSLIHRRPQPLHDRLGQLALEVDTGHEDDLEAVERLLQRVLAEERGGIAQPPAGDRDALGLAGDCNRLEPAGCVLGKRADDADAAVAVGGVVVDRAERTEDLAVEHAGRLVGQRRARIGTIVERVGQAILRDAVDAERQHRQRHLPRVLAVEVGAGFMRQRHVEVERLAAARPQDAGHQRRMHPAGDVVGVVHVADDVEIAEQVGRIAVVDVVAGARRHPGAMVGAEPRSRGDPPRHINDSVDVFGPAVLLPVLMSDVLLQDGRIALCRRPLQVAGEGLLDLRRGHAELFLGEPDAGRAEVFLVVRHEPRHG